jgi:hypothetical protein
MQVYKGKVCCRGDLPFTIPTKLLLAMLPKCYIPKFFPVSNLESLSSNYSVLLEGMLMPEELEKFHLECLFPSSCRVPPVGFFFFVMDRNGRSVNVGVSWSKVERTRVHCAFASACASVHLQVEWYFHGQEIQTRGYPRDFRLPPPSKWGIRSSGMLCSVEL